MSDDVKRLRDLAAWQERDATALERHAAEVEAGGDAVLAHEMRDSAASARVTIGTLARAADALAVSAQVVFRCDGCGKRESGYFAGYDWHKPEHWFARSDREGAQLACSRACIEGVANASGKTGVVVPL